MRAETHLIPPSTGTTDQIFTKDIDKPSVNGWSDVIELGNEGVFQPIDCTFTQEDYDRWREYCLNQGEGGQ